MRIDPIVVIAAVVMSRTIQARRFRPDDAQLAFEVIGAIKEPESRPDFSADYLRRFLSRPQNVLIVALNDVEPAGFLLAYMLDRVDRDQQMVCLYEIGVSRRHRRRGVGRAMIDVLKGVCGQAAAMKAWGITNRSNEPAVRLYESTGAQPDPSGDEVTFVWSAAEWKSGMASR